jgi:tRNA threonylcarbamoyl adenosine modification protein YeaZ
MRLLAIDTSLEACSVGVGRDGAPDVLISEVIGRGHAERLFGMIRSAMAEAGLAFADLDRIAVTVGPGSFTGLRVGIATARGLALVVECPVVGIGTLAVHAATARAMAGPHPVLALLDAHRGELYGQAFAADGSAIGEPEIADADVFAARVALGMVLAGSGAELVAERLGSPVDVVHDRSSPDLAALMELARSAADTGSPPRPLYLRAPDARPQQGKEVARQ